MTLIKARKWLELYGSAVKTIVRNDGHTRNNPNWPMIRDRYAEMARLVAYLEKQS